MTIINIFINRIYLYDDHYTLILNGGNRGVELENIPLEVLDSSAFNGVSEQIRCSSLVADAPPKKEHTRCGCVPFFLEWGIEPIECGVDERRRRGVDFTKENDHPLAVDGHYR